MTVKLHRSRRTEKQDDHESLPVDDAVLWRATYAYEANGFRYTDEAYIEHVSRNGCVMRGRTRLEIGSTTTLTFYLADQERPLRVRARVTSVTDEALGVKFLRLSSEAYGRMQRYVLTAPAASSLKTAPTKPLKAALRVVLSLLLTGLLSACGTFSSPVPVSAHSGPFFNATTEERATLALSASQLEAVAAECAADNSCDEHVHFSRALVSLFENREAAHASFEKVITLNPASPLATSSALWLRLLNDDGDEVAASSRPLLVDLIRQWLQQSMARPVTVPSSEERISAVPKPALVQALHQQVRERDRHIARLRAQLDALKVISQDQEDRRQMRPPASFVPKRETGR